MDNLVKVAENDSIREKGFYVYKGMCKETGKLLYIGTTTQAPRDRFRWHKSNGKDFNFEIIAICNNADEMLDKEFNLIREYKPCKNKIVSRKQNDNRALSETDVNSRVGNKQWCQSCLKRRVNRGYKKCYYC